MLYITYCFKFRCVYLLGDMLDYVSQILFKEQGIFCSSLQVALCYDKGPLLGINEIYVNDIFVHLKYLQFKKLKIK